MPSQGSPTPVSSSPNQGSGSGASGNSGNSSSTPVLVTGTHPAWSILQLPAPPPATTPAISSTPESSALLPTPVTEDSPGSTAGSSGRSFHASNLPYVTRKAASAVGSPGLR